MVSANAIIENVDYEEWNDHLVADKAKLKKVKGITALEDQKIMSGYAAKLRSVLDSRIKREFDCSTDAALLNVLEKDQTKYLFVINDKRTYAKRFEQYKAILDKTVPQTITILSNIPSDKNLYIYDMIERRELKTIAENNNIKFDVSLSSLGGKIIAVLPVKIKKIEIKTPQTINLRNAEYDLSVMVSDENDNSLCGITPIQIDIIDSVGDRSDLSGYYAAENGKLNIKFTPAYNDVAGKWKIKATELISGKNTVGIINIKK
jgi:hypothetical protein